MGACCSNSSDLELDKDDFGFVPQGPRLSDKEVELRGPSPLAKPEKFTEIMRQRSRESEASTDREGGDIESLTGVGVALHQTAFGDAPAVQEDDVLHHHPTHTCGDEVNDCGDCD